MPVPDLIAGVVCSSRGTVGVTVSGRVVVSANRNKKKKNPNIRIKMSRMRLMRMSKNLGNPPPDGIQTL